jgi:periplasmic divalent cation tolerance protein
LSAAVIVSTSIDSEASARAIARAVVEERLAACAHVMPVTSIYRWRGNVEEQAEWVCHLKTTPERIETLTARIRALHAYEVPEILAIPVIAGFAPYLEWVAESVGEA